MKNILTLIFSAFLLLEGYSQVPRTVIVEHFTNTWCSICSSRNPGFYQTLENYPDVLHIAYHPSSPYSGCIFNQHNSWENDQRTYFYDVYGSTPRVVIQGEVIPAQNPLIKPEQIDTHLNGSSDYAVSMTKTELGDNTLKITVNIERVNGDQYETILVYAGLAEKEVDYDAPNGENLHHDVFRKVIFYDTASVYPVGQTKTIEYEYTTDPSWDENQIYAFAIVHHSITFEVMQAGTTLSSPSGFYDNDIIDAGGMFYPNPGSGIIRLKDNYANSISSIELFDLLGNKVSEYHGSVEIDITELPEGIYFARLVDMNRDTYSTRIIKTNK